MTDTKTEETGGERTRLGIADYLEQFDRSPYSYPACDYRPVEGVSTQKGSWFQGTDKED